jgi:hypothetical protein
MFDGMLEMWKREGKLCWERTRRLIDDDLAGSLLHEQKKWTITMTNEHHLVLKEDTNRKQHNG